MKYYILYRTAGDWPDMSEHTAGPYSEKSIHSRAQDFASYAGVYDVRILQSVDPGPLPRGVAELNLGQPVGDWVPIY